MPEHHWDYLYVAFLCYAVREKNSYDLEIMANVIQSQPEYKGKVAKYLKLLACMTENGLDVRLAPYSVDEPQVDGYITTWQAVELIGNALYAEHITAAQAKMLISEHSKND